ncbi:hypothetical protein HK100_012558 [Physocladia obscura]|uniref:Uncharacterized protein n=1 Tax=Physocladia obscura TaxID=109957 RepID=A0AAD5T5L5_9FUNG|nr:hypothetical protein HK100_012558 [Physocladia obscura]
MSPPILQNLEIDESDDVLAMYSSSSDIHQISEDATDRAPHWLSSDKLKTAVSAPPIPATEYSGTSLGRLNTTSSSSSSRSSNSTTTTSSVTSGDNRKDSAYSSLQRRPRVNSQTRPPLSVAINRTNSNGILSPSSSSAVASRSASVGRNGGGGGSNSGGGKLLLLNLIDELDASIEKTRRSSIDEFVSDSLPRERGRRRQQQQQQRQRKQDSPVVAIPPRSQSRSWRMNEF